METEGRNRCQPHDQSTLPCQEWLSQDRLGSHNATFIQLSASIAALFGQQFLTMIDLQCSQRTQQCIMFASRSTGTLGASFGILQIFSSFKSHLSICLQIATYHLLFLQFVLTSLSSCGIRRLIGYCIYSYTVPPLLISPPSIFPASFSPPLKFSLTSSLAIFTSTNVNPLPYLNPSLSLKTLSSWPQVFTL